ncbi:MAG: hypothetical protein AAF821_01490 [Cyanobacteria bacterium P01_D01_bin.156]
MSPSTLGGGIDSASSSTLMLSSSRNQVWINLPGFKIADIQLGQPKRHILIQDGQSIG